MRQLPFCIIDNWSLESAARLLQDGLYSIQMGEITTHLRMLGDHITVGMSPEVSPQPTFKTYTDTPTAYFGALSNVLKILDIGFLYSELIIFITESCEKGVTSS